jgi:hypothetical protein
VRVLEELIKFASMSAALPDTLPRRGVGDPAASLTAEIATGVLRTAFERLGRRKRTSETFRSSSRSRSMS